MKAKVLPFAARVVLIAIMSAVPVVAAGQGVTTASLTGFVMDEQGVPLTAANVLAVHVPSGTQYRGSVTSSGRYSLPNIRIGGPYTVTATSLGFDPQSESNVTVGLGQSLRLDFRLKRRAIELSGVTVTADRDEVLNAGRTGAATRVSEAKVAVTPSIKRSTRDLTKLDPRSDGNMSFAGKNWLYNNISLDGS